MNRRFLLFVILVLFTGINSCVNQTSNDIVLERIEYEEKLKGFWLGSCIANWTGLKTEAMRNDKPYFTDEDWNTDAGSDELEITNSTYLDYVLNMDPWLADDDTDIEYIFQHAMEYYNTTKLTGQQIKEQWLEHIKNSLHHF